MTTFLAIDVETANASRHSICQIGAVGFQEGVALWRWQTLVNPEEPFDAINEKIHGITADHVRFTSKFPAVLDYLRPTMKDHLVACYGPFDYEALLTASEKYSVEKPSCNWIDVCDVARLAWPSLQSHALKSVCGHLNISLEHHDAGSDALACGRILIQAAAKMGKEFSALLEEIGSLEHTIEYRETTSRQNRYPERIELKGRKEGPLAGHVVVFTGELSIGEAKMAELAATLGCDVEDNFTQKRTTILVTGYRDPLLYDTPKSGKHIAAEKAIAKGKNVAVMSEADFLALAKRLGLAAA
jgi:DNA polymerase-3 subunit epsilon